MPTTSDADPSAESTPDSPGTAHGASTPAADPADRAAETDRETTAPPTTNQLTETLSGTTTSGRFGDAGRVRHERRRLGEIGDSHDVSSEIVDRLDVLIVTAVGVEYEAITTVFGSQRARWTDGTRCAWGLAVSTLLSTGGHRYRVGVLQTDGAGVERSLLPVNRAVEVLEPQLVLLAGIAAGVPDGSMELGDVVVSSWVESVQVEKVGTGGLVREGFAPSKEHVDGIARLHADLQPGWPLRRGIVVTTNNVIRDASYRDRLAAEVPGTIAFEMESGAVAQACRANRVPWVTVKAIVDWASETKDDTFHVIGAQRVAGLLREYLRDGPLRMRSPNPAPARPQARSDSTWTTVPAAALYHASSTYVPPESHQRAERRLAATGTVVLVGPARSGKRIAALNLLGDTCTAIRQVAAGTRLDGLDPGDLLEGVGLLIDDPGTSLSVDGYQRFRDLVQRHEGHAVVLVDSASDGSGRRSPWLSLDDVVEWVFLDDVERLRAAVALNARMHSSTTPVAEIERLIDMAESETVVRGIQDSRDLCAVARAIGVGLDENWPTDRIIATADGAAATATIDRIEALESDRHRAWFVGAAMFQGGPLALVSHFADALAVGLGEDDRPADAPAPSRFGSSRSSVLSKIGADLLPDGTVRLHAIDGVAASETIWREFVQIHREIVDATRRTAEIIDAATANVIATAAGRLLFVDRELVRASLLEPWLRGDSVVAALVAGAAWATATELGLDAAWTRRTLRRFLEDHDEELAIGAALASTTSLADLAPESVVVELLCVAELSTARRERRTPREQAALYALAELLDRPGSSDVLLSELLRRVQDVVERPLLRRTIADVLAAEVVLAVLFNVGVGESPPPSTPALGSPRSIEVIGRLIALFIELPFGRTPVEALLERWLVDAGDDPEWVTWLDDVERAARADGYRSTVTFQTARRRAASTRRRDDRNERSTAVSVD